MRIFFTFLFIVTMVTVKAQNAQVWKNKQCTVVLTYDDAIDVDLDHAIPVLDSLKLKGTFYLIGSSQSLSSRMDEWRKVAKEGHELGNHAMFHPCDGSKPGRGFVTPENDLSKYTMAREANEIKMNNLLLKAIDGKDKRTFAYPCGDLKIGNELIYPHIEKDFVAARGVGAGMQTIDKVNLSNIDCYMINGQSADYMINLVKQAMQTHTLLVFLFHGVGGGHNLNVGLGEHSKLLHFLKDNEKNIWIAPMVDVAEHIKTYQDSNKSK
ncbi:MAG: Polysaccharide deacetylase [Mucilaginibacter sp.]|nr:Polysaccharide deacetylase [Mucilaginibacter sp.]